ncbi:MAG TPA: helix-turn-helix domain-containing protein [Actinotalea sp.]|nr:helix-turn-helix domain-containing protein [Actinotalea sp.]
MREQLVDPTEPRTEGSGGDRPGRGPRDEPGVHAALASPVRRGLMARLRAAADAPTAAELADHLALHVTTVRFHLDQLERAGLVLSSTDHTRRRGRPAVRYRAVDVDLAAAHEQMIDALAQAAAGSASPEENARSAGRRWAEGVPSRTGDARSALTDVLGRLGFEPEPGDDVVRLRGCPFRSAARRTPQVVCQVHLGLVQAIAARADDGDRLHVGLVPFAEPETCHLTLTTTTRSPR